MAWNPYTDQKNRAYSNILTSMFPEQTKTIPRIIVWSIIFLLDLILGIAGAVHLGIFQPGSFRNTNSMMLGAGLLVAAIVAVFWLQGFVWYKAVKAIQKSRELD